MVLNIPYRWLERAALWCACLWCLAAHVQADFEIESFTRYRLIRIDNNNNGYVDDFDITDQSSFVENTAATDALESKDSLLNELPANNNSAQSASRNYAALDTSEALRNNSGSVHVAPRIPNGFGIVDYAFTGPVGYYTAAVDYDNLHTFNVAFASVKGFTYLQGRGVQLERVIRFSPELVDGETQPAEPNSTFEVFGGIRFYRFDDAFTFDAAGGILGRTWAQTTVENQHGGPHLGMLWSLRHAGWTLALSGLVQGGLGATDSRQLGAIGEDLNPGAVNSPLYAQPHAVNYQVEDQFGSIYSEARVQMKREITDQISVVVGCSAYYYGDIKYADTSVNWFIPDMGLISGTEHSTVTTAFASLELRH